MADITLPAADEMMRRLRTVIDEPHAVRNFYPKLTAEAGEAKSRAGVELMVMLAIEDYAGAMPGPYRALMVAVPDFVRVLTDA